VRGARPAASSLVVGWGGGWSKWSIEAKAFAHSKMALQWRVECGRNDWSAGGGWELHLLQSTPWRSSGEWSV
jgi:hypothetical protein